MYQQGFNKSIYEFIHQPSYLPYNLSPLCNENRPGML